MQQETFHGHGKSHAARLQGHTLSMLACILLHQVSEEIPAPAGNAAGLPEARQFLEQECKQYDKEHG